ncbi:MAG: sugar-binding domain-containing protein [Melioribacteraceae bacterium]
MKNLSISNYLPIILLFLFTNIKSQEKGNNFYLSEGWKIESSSKLSIDGSVISSQNYIPVDWLPILVPATIFTGLRQNNLFQDVFISDNLKKIDREQFNSSWWYRCQFNIEKKYSNQFVKLFFEGINYRANIWLNGKIISDTSKIFGSFRQFEIDVTKYLSSGNKNVLAIELFPPQKGDPTIGFVDWNPKAPDNNMGLWRGVLVKISGSVSLINPFVKSKIEIPSLLKAELTISAEIKNNSNQEVTGKIIGKIEGITFGKDILLKPNEKRTVSFTPEEFNNLIIKNPRIWWTYSLGKQELYNLELTFTIDNKESDYSKVKFGIREVKDYLTPEGYRGYKLNGKNILILGGGWVDNLFLDNSTENIRTQLQYVRDMGLNTIRLEGFWGKNKDIYDICDEYGILIMTGWSCEWEWEVYIGKPDDDFGSIKSNEDIDLISQSWQDQIKWLRNHPSVFLWVYGSDKLPRPELEKKYIEILKNDDPTRPFLAAAKGLTSTITGITGVKMFGPYDYVPPKYWWQDKENGGAYGFNTEVGIGAQIPVSESIRKMIPESSLNKIDSIWNYHCGGFSFGNLKNYNEAIENRLGISKNFEDYSDNKAQFINYEGTRSMFESHVANRYNATGIIQWMLNGAWPKLWWQLYDYYLVPNASYFATKKALEPVHIMYDYNTKNIFISNLSFKSIDDAEYEIAIFDFEMKKIFSKSSEINIKVDDIALVLENLSLPKNEGAVYFLDLKVKANEKTLSRNFYTLPASDDILDIEKTDWTRTPTLKYSNLKVLNNLENIKLGTEISSENNLKELKYKIKLVNKTDKLAFQINIKALSEKGELIAPIFLEDNYFSLLPSERREVELTIPIINQPQKISSIKISGWNIEPIYFNYE